MKADVGDVFMMRAFGRATDGRVLSCRDIPPNNLLTEKMAPDCIACRLEPYFDSL